ncbi:MAG: hypothetical protein ACJAR6_001469 [Oleispira sp.]
MGNGKTRLNRENIDEAKCSANNAKTLLTKLKDPKIEYKLQMTATFIETDQSVKAQKIIDKLKESIAIPTRSARYCISASCQAPYKPSACVALHCYNRSLSYLHI